VQIVRTLKSQDGMDYVDIVRRANGTYGFQAYHWDGEDGCFVPSGHYSESFTDSIDRAVAEASARVDWLIETIRAGVPVEVRNRE
jgi:hypothetical protein